MERWSREEWVTTLALRRVPADRAGRAHAEGGRGARMALTDVDCETARSSLRAASFSSYPTVVVRKEHLDTVLAEVVHLRDQIKVLADFLTSIEWSAPHHGSATEVAVAEIKALRREPITMVPISEVIDKWLSGFNQTDSVSAGWCRCEPKTFNTLDPKDQRCPMCRKHVVNEVLL